MISRSKRVIRSHSENARKAKDKISQIVSIIFEANEEDLEEQNTEK